MNEQDPPQVAHHLISAVDGLSGIALSSLMAVIWVSLVAVAILQLAKQLTPMRTVLHRSQTNAWLARLIKNAGPPEGAAEEGPWADLSIESVMKQLVDLSAGGGRATLFALPADQLAGQIGVAAQIVFEQPDRYPSLLRVLASGTKKIEIEAILEDRTREIKEKDEYRPNLDLRARVNNQIQRNIDRLMLDIGRRWRWMLRLGVMIISAVLLIFGLTLIASVEGQEGTLYNSTLEVFIWFSMVILSGYLGPALYDIISRLQGSGNR